MSELSNPLSLEERARSLAERLDSRVGSVHPRLIEQSKRLTVGDLQAANLTYTQILLHDESVPSLDLPTGSIKCTDLEVATGLLEGHLTAIDRFLSNYYTSGIPTELAGERVYEFQDIADKLGLASDWPLHPRVEGYEWYRGYFVPTAEHAGIMLFDPWMQPWDEGGSPAPVVYTFGEPPTEIVRQVAQAYSEHRAGSHSLSI